MNAFEILIPSILIIGIIVLVSLILFNFKDFLRRLKNGWGYGVRSKYAIPIISFPIWGPFYLADKIFHLGIFKENEKKHNR